MKATVNDDCIGCGLCVSACPGVFFMQDTKAEAVPGDIPAGDVAAAEQAAGECPVSAIEISE